MSALQIIQETEQIALIEIFDPDWPSNPLRFHVVEIDRDVGLVASITKEDSTPPRSCAFSVTGIRNVSTPHTRNDAQALLDEKLAEQAISTTST